MSYVFQSLKNLKHHRLTEHIKIGKSDKLRVIVNHHQASENTENYASEGYQTSDCDDEGNDVDEDEKTDDIADFDAHSLRCCALCLWR